MSDAGFRTRLLQNAVLAMFVAVLFGSPVYLAGCIGSTLAPQPASALHRRAIRASCNTAAVVFWMLFPVLFILRVYKTAAVLDFERRVRFAEDLFRRGQSLARDSAAEMMRSSMPGAKGTGQP